MHHRKIISRSGAQCDHKCFDLWNAEIMTARWPNKSHSICFAWERIDWFHVINCRRHWKAILRWYPKGMRRDGLSRVTWLFPLQAFINLRRSQIKRRLNAYFFSENNLVCAKFAKSNPTRCERAICFNYYGWTRVNELEAHQQKQFRKEMEQLKLVTKANKAELFCSFANFEDAVCELSALRRWLY